MCPLSNACLFQHSCRCQHTCIFQHPCMSLPASLPASVACELKPTWLRVAHADGCGCYRSFDVLGQQLLQKGNKGVRISCRGVSVWKDPWQTMATVMHCFLNPVSAKVGECSISHKKKPRINFGTRSVYNELRSSDTNLMPRNIANI